MVLSVIIVNYNGKLFLEDCLNSVRTCLNGIEHEVIIIDNNSSDNSNKYIKENFREVVLIESKENLGFGKGNNEAVKRAKGNFLLLLNNDTILQNSMVPLLDFFKDDNIGIVGINMLDANKKHLQAAGNFPSFFNLLWMKLAFKINSDFIEGNFKKEYYEVDWLTGSFLLLPKKVYDEVGGFDEDYFLYVEDVDFCKRIADKGYKRLFISTISYIHFVGFKKEKNPLLINGFKIYINKHFKGIKKWANYLALFINSLVKKINK